MAQQSLLLLTLIFSSLTLSPLLVHARSLIRPPKKSTILNVTASLPSSTTDQSEPNSDSPLSLTLTLHPRESHHRDYRSRILTILARDSSRVHSLQTRLALAINSQSYNDELSRTNRGVLESPITSGTSQGSGEYFARLGIGNPPRQLYVVIDTGSDVSWVQCQPCSECYSQSDPIFDPTKSSTYQSLPCNSSQCRSLDVSECRAGHLCVYEVSYGDGSYTIGDFATERVTFSGGDRVDDVAIGCGHTNDGLFVGAGGLLGLGGGKLSFPSQINATSFSYCLVDRESSGGSTLEFNSVVGVDGGGSSGSRDSGLVVAPLVKNPQLDTFYYVGLTGITVGGEQLALPTSAFDIDGDGNGGVIIDSGTAVTRLETSVYEALRDSFRGGTSHLPTAEGVAIFDTCYNLTGRSTVRVPAVELQFAAGNRLPLPAKNYMIPVDSEGTFCLAFAGTTSSMSIIGNVQQQGTRVGFDLVKKVVTFERNKC